MLRTIFWRVCVIVLIFLPFLNQFVVSVLFRFFIVVDFFEKIYHPLISLFFFRSLFYMKECKWLSPTTCLHHHAFSWIFLKNPKLHYVLLMSQVQRYVLESNLCTRKIFLTITFVFFKNGIQTSCMIYTLVTLIFWMFHHFYFQLLFRMMMTCFLCLSSLCRFQMVQPVITF
jgi:hypothetical protein